MLDVLAPWLDDDPITGRVWIDWPSAVDESGYLSGGERRLVRVGASLVTYGNGCVAVNLNDVLIGLDESNGRIVAHALAHALGFKPRTGDQR